MIKKNEISIRNITIVAFVLFVISVVPAYAHTVATKQQAVSLPGAGIMPNSPFYFLDQWSENIQEFFTFNPEAKAKLQIQFAGERISEIKQMVQNDKVGINDKGIARAKGLLLANVAQAATILQDQKSKGKDVAALANQINTSFNAQEQLLVDTFQDARKKLNSDRNALLAKSGVAVVNSKKTKTPNDNTLTAAKISVQAQRLANESANLKGIQDNFQTLFGDQQTKIVNTLDFRDKKAHDQREALQEKKSALRENELKKMETESENEQKQVEKDIEKETEKKHSSSSESSASGTEGENSSSTKKNGGEGEGGTGYRKEGNSTGLSGQQNYGGEKRNSNGAQRRNSDGEGGGNEAN